MSCCFVSLVRLVGNRRHVADLGSIEQDHRTQRGRNGGCGVSPGPFAAVIRLSRLCCLWHRRRTVLIAAKYELIRPLRYHSSASDRA